MSLLTINNVTIPDKIVIVSVVNDWIFTLDFLGYPLKARISKFSTVEMFYFDYQRNDEMRVLALFPEEIEMVTWVTWEKFERLKAFV